jgi:hypothetical protein
LSRALQGSIHTPSATPQPLMAVSPAIAPTRSMGTCAPPAQDVDSCFTTTHRGVTITGTSHAVPSHATVSLSGREAPPPGKALWTSRVLPCQPWPARTPGPSRQYFTVSKLSLLPADQAGSIPHGAAFATCGARGVEPNQGVPARSETTKAWWLQEGTESSCRLLLPPPPWPLAHGPIATCEAWRPALSWLPCPRAAVRPCSAAAAALEHSRSSGGASRWAGELAPAADLGVWDQ